MRSTVLGAVLASALLLVACDSKQPAPEKAPTKESPTQESPTQESPTQESPTQESPTARAPLVDLTASSTLAAARAVFNAHKGEARFLTLLSPT